MIKIKRENYPYRQAVVSVIVDGNNMFLVVQKLSYRDNEWSFASGGVEDNESPSEAILRELREELGVKSFKIIAEAKTHYQYEWPEKVIIEQFHKLGKYFRGQQLKYFLIKFLGNQSDIKPQEEEIRVIKWITYDQLSSHLLFPGQLESAEKVIKEFNLSF